MAVGVDRSRERRQAGADAYGQHAPSVGSTRGKPGATC